MHAISQDGHLRGSRVKLALVGYDVSVEDEQERLEAAMSELAARWYVELLRHGPMRAGASRRLARPDAQARRPGRLADHRTGTSVGHISCEGCRRFPRLLTVPYARRVWPAGHLGHLP
jgi:hypothetical protein